MVGTWLQVNVASALALASLSLLPFVTAWMGASGVAMVPVAAYGAVLFMCAVSYTLLEHRLVRLDRPNAGLALTIGADRKGWLSLAAYACGIALGLVHAWMGLAIYVAVAIAWFIPDRRLEPAVGAESRQDGKPGLTACRECMSTRRRSAHACALHAEFSSAAHLARRLALRGLASPRQHARHNTMVVTR